MRFTQSSQRMREGCKGKYIHHCEARSNLTRLKALKLASVISLKGWYYYRGCVQKGKIPKG